MRRQHRRKREDPLVPIDGARVRSAIEWRGLSVNHAAARMRVSQQTLDSIVRSKTKRCYQSLREKLAALLDLPATWLGSETDLLPSLTPWLPPPDLGYTPPLWVDENMRIMRPPQGGNLSVRTSLPPRYQLAASELCGQVVTAWKRDIDHGNKEAKTALARLGDWNRVMMLISRLLGAYWWRRSFLKPLPLPEAVDPKRYTDAEWRALGRRITRENERRAAEELAAADALAEAAATTLATTLGPWFADERELNYAAFVGVLEWASHGFGLVPREVMEFKP
jgi:hypothetical protein